MKLEVGQPLFPHSLKDLSPGDVFDYEGEPLMVVEKGGIIHLPDADGVPAVELCNGQATWFQNVPTVFTFLGRVRVVKESP